MRSRLVREAELVGVCRGKERIQTLEDWKKRREGRVGDREEERK